MLLIELKPAYIEYYYIHIPIAYKDLFPDNETKVYLETKDLGVLETGFYPRECDGPGFHRWGLRKWFKAHPELKAGDKVRISVIEPMQKYRLEIVK